MRRWRWDHFAGVVLLVVGGIVVATKSPSELFIVICQGVKMLFAGKGDNRIAWVEDVVTLRWLHVGSVTLSLVLQVLLQ